MNIIKIIIAFFICSIFVACSPIKTTITNQYKLERYSSLKQPEKTSHYSILISMPDAMAGYQTEQMIYSDKPFELSNFAHNAWVSSPATMLYPLMIQSLQNSSYFFAVAAGPDADKADYRLDTQLIELKQNFLTKPSQIQLTANLVLTHINDMRVVASHIIHITTPCPTDTPYGGVLAANQATSKFTAQLTRFVVKKIKKDAD